MDDQTAPNIDQKVSASKGKALFRPIEEFLVEEGADGRTEGHHVPSEDEVDAWITEHPGCRRGDTLKILCGFPEKGTFEMPCLAQVWYDDHVLVLNVDGTTHRFWRDEVEMPS